MEINTYTALPEAAKAIRITVFVEEQGLVEEFDKVDNTAIHLVAYEDKEPLATCRYYPMDEEGCYLIGRIAVLRPYRGRGLGGKLIQEAEAQIKALGGKKIHIGAQIQALPFYRKLGYSPVGEGYMEEHVPHQGMQKEI